MPSSREARIAVTEEDSGGVSLGSIVAARSGRQFASINRFSPRNRFVVQQSVNREARHAHIGIENDEPSRGRQRPARFFKECSWRLKVMKYIEQDQVGKRTLLEGKFVAVTYKVEPRIGKEVRTNGALEVGFEIPNARADFQDLARNSGINQLNDAAIETSVDLLKEWFALPKLQILLNFGLMLVNLHQAKNLSRRAANQTIRNNSQPCFQREMLVSPYVRAR